MSHRTIVRFSRHLVGETVFLGELKTVVESKRLLRLVSSSWGVVSTPLGLGLGSFGPQPIQSSPGSGSKTPLGIEVLPHKVHPALLAPLALST